MITQFVSRFMTHKDELRAKFRHKRPWSYLDIVRGVVEVITTAEYGEYAPDPERIHSIDDGNHQGTLVFIIAEKGYQPFTYYYLRVAYGSCSGCDTLQAARNLGDWNDVTPSSEELEACMMLALHVVQGIKKMSEEVSQ